MTKLCIVGGKLQGTEAAYLARKAGYRTVLVDKAPKAPATSLVDEFHILDVVKDERDFAKVLEEVDAVLPAVEDLDVLIRLEEACQKSGIPFLQDTRAFQTTSNKLKSKSLFERLSIPQPKPWPASIFPVVVKPAHLSGSVGIHRVDDAGSLSQAIKRVLEFDSEYLIQEFVNGAFLSLELLRDDKHVQALQVTGLEFDENYGCKRVIAPSNEAVETEETLIQLGKRIADGLGLYGLTDLQVAACADGIKVIEVNARLPSQTPTVVLNSTNINIVELLYALVVNGDLPLMRIDRQKGVIYEHVKVSRGSLTVCGEHALSNAQSLTFKEGFFGVDEAVTNMPNSGSPENCVATLIARDVELRKAKKKIEEAVGRIMTKFDIHRFNNPSPKGAHSFYDKVDA